MQNVLEVKAISEWGQGVRQQCIFLCRRVVSAGVTRGMRLSRASGGSGHGESGHLLNGGEIAQFAAEAKAAQVVAQAELHQLPAHELARREAATVGLAEFA